MRNESIISAIGRDVLAPLLSVWAEAAIDWLRTNSDVHAVALWRDGALAETALQKLAPDLTPRLGHAWIGRRQAAIAAIADADDHENLENFLIRMRHAPARWDEAASDLGLASHGADNPPLTGTVLARFRHWLTQPDRAHFLRQHTAEMRRRLLAHLDRQAPPQAPLLLLDVGYAATVQRCLKRIHALAERPRPLHGLYLLTSPGATWAEPGPGLVRAVLAQYGQPPALATALLRHRDVLECLLGTDRGELSHYDDLGQPFSSASPLAPDQHRQSAEIQQAALAMLGPSHTLAQAGAALMRFLLKPSLAEASLVGTWQHADSTALEGLRRLDDGPPDGDRSQTLWPAAARLRTESRSR